MFLFYEFILLCVSPVKKRKHGDYYLEDYMNEIRNEMENMFKNIMPEEVESAHRPPVELSESNGNYQLRAQLPGIRKEDIDVEVYEDSVRIKAETKEERKEEHENLYRSEFRYGKFMRNIPLPSEVRSEEAKADFHDGVLTITMPKTHKEEKGVKKLTVE